MGAALKIGALAPRSGARKGLGCGNREEPASGPKRPASGETGAAARSAGRSLLTAEDIRAAVGWRLADVPPADVSALAKVLRPLAGDFREDRPEVAAVLRDLRYPGDRRNGWSLACAILALDAERRGDAFLFATAGFEVVAALRQSRRSHGDRNPLTPVMRAFKAEQPALTSEQAFEQFAEIAKSRTGVQEVLAGYAERDDALILRDASELSRESFCRQYRRL